MGAELVLAADQFIITPAGRVRGRGPGARRRRRGPHGHRRLSLVHRLGPRHDDQPRRADAHHRAARRGRLHSADVRPLRPRRADPQPVSRRARTRGSITRPTRRSGSSTRSHRYLRGDRRPRDARRSAAHAASTSSSITCEGTRFGIGVDPADGLLRQGAPGYQLTWMDAKVGDWVVTPRRGKAVEINALWYNALRLLEEWLDAERRPGGGQAASASTRAGGRRVQRALLVRARRLPLRRRRWRGRRRPGVPARTRCWRSRCDSSGARRSAAGRAVLDVVRERLLTPVGLRSLAPGHPDYKATLRRRPALARRRLSPGHGLGVADRSVRRRLAERVSRRPGAARGFSKGSVAPPERTPASARSARSSTPRRPSRPRGCVAQAWSVAEVLRAWILTGPPNGLHSPR